MVVILRWSLGIVTSTTTLATQKVIKLFDNKTNKHINIKILAKTKLDSIIGTISKALTDNTISDDEFKQVLVEIERYTLMKDDIRHQFY